MRKHLEITPNLEPLFGTRDENLRLIEDALDVRIDLRSDAVHVEGSEEAVARVERIFQDFDTLRRQGILLHNGELNGMLRLVVADPVHLAAQPSPTAGKQRSAGVKRMVQPRSLQPAQIRRSHRAVRHGLRHRPRRHRQNLPRRRHGRRPRCIAKKVSRIVLVRPAVEAGERLGFLPGSLQEKVDPYLRPLYDALYDLLEPERVDKMLERNVIEVAPLAFMRGRTLNDAFIIMDEAQNTTIEQMKMFLTRMGNNSKAVITGDITQIDLPNPRSPASSKP